MDVIFWNGGINSWGTLSRYIGPYKIAHWIRKHGYDAQVIDFIDKLSEKSIYSATTKFITSNTRILALSTTFLANSSYKWSDGTVNSIPESCFNVLTRIKKEHPSIKIVLGGYASEHIAGWGLVDATIMSYTSASEDIFLEYLEHLTHGSPLPGGQLIFPKWGSNLSTHRMMYNRANTSRYSIEQDDFRWSANDNILPGEPLPLDVSRGCIFACRFCQYPHLGKKKLDYIRGMDYIEAELRYNYEQFGTTHYYMLDDTFNDTEFKMQEFYNMTQRLPFKIKYSAYLRADLIHRFPNTAELLQASGLFGAYHGIETFHPTASKLIAKGWSGTHAKEYIPKLYHDIWGGKIPQHTNFIVGITGDTKNNIKETVKWYHDNNLHSIHFVELGLFGPNNSTSQFTIQSEFDRNAEKYGFRFTEYNEELREQMWENDNWTSLSAKAVATMANNAVAKSIKSHIWIVPNLLWYGASEESMFTTTNAQRPWDWYKVINNNKLQEYFNNLLLL